MTNNNNNNNDNTIYQNLSKLFNLDGFSAKNQPITSPISSNNDKIIIKGTSPEEIRRKALELEQKRELQNKYFRTSERSYQKALQYEAGRLQAYIDFESMEYYPLISSALDLYMEEATTIGLNGKMLNIYSNKERIKYLLEELFYDIINVNVNLPFWTRNVTKYGDNFVCLLGERKKGISYVKQLVNYEIERFDRVVDGKPLVKFKERLTGDEFNAFEIAHFRLLGDDKYIPYGSSVLNKVRRVFRQCLDGKTKIQTPDGYKFIENINIGDDIYSFDYEMDKVIRSKVKNVSNNGIKERFLVKTKHNEIKLTNDHLLLTYNINNNVYEYKDIITINVESDYLVSLGRVDDIYVKIDDIESIGNDVVWDIEVDNELHNFIAEGLVVHNCVLAEDAMLTYRLIRAGEKKVFKIDVGNIDEDDIENYIYKVATKFKKISQVSPNDGQIDYRFHINGNDEDYFLPVRNANTQTGIDVIQGACLALDTKIDLLDGRSLTLSEIIDEYNQGKELWTYSINPNTGIIVKSPITWAGKTRLNTDVVKIILSNGESIITTPDHKFNIKNDRSVKEAKDLIVDELWTYKINERIFVESVLFLNEKQDTGTITVDGDEKYHNFHNFALTCGVFTKNSNLNEIHDIEYLRDNLFMGLSIPKPFLSFQDAAGGGKNMAQFDIRFSKKISRIQQAMIQELNKIAMIHLFLLGYSGDDLTDFTLTLTNPSTQQELLKAELLREQAQTYTELTRSESGIAGMSHTNAKRLIFNMSDREIVNDLKQQKMEKVIMQELQDSPIVIKKSGLFTDIDNKYGEPIEGIAIGGASGGTEQTGMPPTGGGGMPPVGNLPPAGGEMGGTLEGGGLPPVGGEMGGGTSTGGGGIPPLAENKNHFKTFSNENEFNGFVEKLVFGSSIEVKQENEIRKKEIIKENNEINKQLNSIAENSIDEINEILNSKKVEDIDFDELNVIDTE